MRLDALGWTVFAGVRKDADAESLKQAVGSLPEEQKRAIELAFFRGLSHQEIAETLGESLGTVKSRIRYGLSKLRNLVKEGSSHE